MAARRRTGGLARRVVHTLRGRLHTDLHRQLNQIQGPLDEFYTRYRGEMAELRARLERIELNAERGTAISRHIYDEEPANRRRMQQLRRSEDYGLAFTEDEPLVTFIIPTYTSFETLRDVALPSILGQSYPNLEVIVSGDCAPAETAAVIAAIDDPRVVYINRTIRGPYPEDRAKRWFGLGGPPYNDALAIARGRWIAALGDDDAVRPDHTRNLLAAARENGWEHCYGRQQVNFAAGDPIVIGRFPPVAGQWGTQASIFHAGLRFFESELSDAIYDEPSDWSKCRRMLRAGVRIGMLDEIVVDKNEHRVHSAAEWFEAGPPLAD